MDIKTKAKKLLELYQDFEEKAHVHREAAVCAVGCADCCINVGNVDAVTLEGWLILEHMNAMDPGRRSRLKKMIEENARVKEGSIYTRCAFLQDNLSCTIYPVRPFSCRRLYSLVRCGENGPTVHRKVWQMAEETIAAIQALDGDGCFGHLSHILLLLQESGFRKTYLSGDTDTNCTDRS
jgi:Fe-S-cluster containining protein